MSQFLLLHIFTSLWLSVFWILVILRSVWWYPIVVSLCISLMTYDVEHIFICLFAIHISSLGGFYLRFLAYLLIWLFGLPSAQLVKNSPAMQELSVWFLGQENPLEKGKATHSSILVWRIPWTIQSMGSQRVRKDWATFTFTCFSHCWVLKSSLHILDNSPLTDMSFEIFSPFLWLVFSLS